MIDYQHYVAERLESLELDRKYHKMRSTHLARKLEESEDKLSEILKEIRDLKVNYKQPVQ